jgi:galactose oxidase
VPSKAEIIRLDALEGNTTPASPASTRVVRLANVTRTTRRISEEAGSAIVVGFTPSYPYGTGACWGGALGGLQRLHNVKSVRLVPNTVQSLAFVYLVEDKFPNIDTWRKQFADVVNGTYIVRGIEMTISGLVTENNGRLTLKRTTTRAALNLVLLQAADKVQWDIRTRKNKPASDMAG